MAVIFKRCPSCGLRSVRWILIKAGPALRYPAWCPVCDSFFRAGGSVLTPAREEDLEPRQLQRLGCFSDRGAVNRHEAVEEWNSRWELAVRRVREASGQKWWLLFWLVAGYLLTLGPALGVVVVACSTVLFFAPPSEMVELRRGDLCLARDTYSRKHWTRWLFLALGPIAWLDLRWPIAAAWLAAAAGYGALSHLADRCQRSAWPRVVRPSVVCAVWGNLIAILAMLVWEQIRQPVVFWAWSGFGCVYGLVAYDAWSARLAFVLLHLGIVAGAWHVL